MKRLFCLFGVAAQLARSSSAAGINPHDDHDRTSYLRTRGNTGNIDSQQITQHDRKALEIQEEEIEKTQALLSDFDFTSSLRDTFHGQSPSERRLSDETCLPFGNSCQDHTFNCCQGGCNSSKECFCQANEAPCFHEGGEDSFCCSNRCGGDGRCTCIERGESCAVGDEYCCDGLKCNKKGKCVRNNQNNNDNGGATQTQIMAVTMAEPTEQTRTSQGQQQGGGGFFPIDFGCKGENYPCFNLGEYDMDCCSERCGSDGKCLVESNNNDNSPYTTSANNNSNNNSVSPSTSPTPSPTTKPTHTPTGRPTPSPMTNPTHRPTGRPVDAATVARSIFASGGHCDEPNQIKITVEILTDQFGGDTGWSITKPPFGTNILNVPNGTYGLFGYDVQEICVTPGTYNFTITDMYGDGICCGYGHGYVKIYLDQRQVMHVKFQGKIMSETLLVGYDPNPTMTDRDYLYLEAHNSRRMIWYAGNSVDYVPLAYSPMLAEESRAWAEELLVNCSSSGIEHEGGVAEGENLAKNTGLVDENGGGWGQLYPPHNIVNRWVEFEVNRDYPANAHLTQALWRASKYLGCGEAERRYRGGMCRVQVCRYARAGNCEMARYNSTIGRNWLPPMLEGTSRCGPNCPPEGCF